MLSVACGRTEQTGGVSVGTGPMSPTALSASWTNGSARPLPVSILKKQVDSETSSTCSNSSMVRCTRGCKLRVPNTQLHSHNCFERMRQELNDSFGRIDDLEEQLKSQREKEQILRNQVKKLKQELGISGLLEPVPGERVCVSLTRENRTFGFKLLGRAQTDNEGDEDRGPSSITIASITTGSPAHRSSKIFVNDYILEINGVDVTSLSCSDAESVIRSSPDTMHLVLVRSNSTLTSTPRAAKELAKDLKKLPESLPTHFISDEDFDSLSAIGLPDECALDSSQCSEVSELTELSVSPESDERARSSDERARSSDERARSSDSECRALAILEDSREFEEVVLTKKNGLLGITLTYGVNELLGALFVDSIKPDSSAAEAGKPLPHDQILKINDLEVGVDILCDEAKRILSQDGDTVKFELARPKKHEVKVKRKIGQSLGMMVAVSKVEDDKSVIIGTVDPNGLVARYGLFKGLILDKVNDVSLDGLGLKQAVEVLAGCVGEIRFLVYVRPNFSPYRHPRPPTPYPLSGDLTLGPEEEEAAKEEEEEEVTERSVKFSLPPSPARSNTSASIDSIPQDSSARSSPRSDGRAAPSPESRLPYSRSFGNPSINLINTDWSSLDRSFTSDTSLRSLRSSTGRDLVRGPIRVSHQVIPSSVLPFPSSLPHHPSPHHHVTPHHPSPTPHPSLNTYENLTAPRDYENLSRIPDYQRPRGRSPACSPGRSPVPPTPASPGGRSPAPSPAVQKPRVLGRRERAAIGGGDRKVQLGTFRPINSAALDNDEHYV